MKNITISLTSEETTLLKKLTKDFSDNWQITKRLEAIRLVSSGLTVTTVSRQLCVNSEIIYKYIKTFKESGLDGLVMLEKPGKESKLTEEQMVKIEKFIVECRKKKIKCTTQEQVNFVKRNFGVDIGAKWLYKRLLIRKQRDLDSLAPVFIGLITLGNELTYNRVYRKGLFFLIHLISLTPSLIRTA